MADNRYETERLFLVPTTEADAQFVLDLMNSPGWLQYIGDRNVKSIEDAIQYIRVRIRPQYERLGYSNYTMIRKSDHAKIGSCGLYDREGLEGIDIGFALLPQYMGNGYAHEAAQKVRALAIEEFGIREIKAITTKDNVPSQTLLEKLGLELQGTTQVPGDDEELLLYRLTV